MSSSADDGSTTSVQEPSAPPLDGDGTTEDDYRWVRATWLLVAVFALVTALRSRHVGIPVRDPGGDFFRIRLLVSSVLVGVLALLDAWWRARRAPGGLTWRAALRTRWTPRRLALTASALLAYHLVYYCYHNLKSWDVFNRPRDAMLLRWDRWLFAGHAPAQVLHHLLGQHVAAYVLMAVYESFSTLVTVGVVAAVVLVPRVRDGYVFISSALWVWILGVGSYYLVPSLGPFHSAPRLFAGLPHTMIQDTQAKYLAQRAFLLAHPHSVHGFAQVSAFASLHVAVSTLLLLMAWYHRLRMVTAVLAVFVATTMVATVYLGWHFAVDDLAGLLIACVSVCLGRWMTYPRGRRPSGEVAATA